jgi:hypothetical protein
MRERKEIIVNPATDKNGNVKVVPNENGKVIEKKTNGNKFILTTYISRRLKAGDLVIADTRITKQKYVKMEG